MKKQIALGITAVMVLYLFIKKPTSLLLGAARGMMLCYEVVIPSIFPFTVLALIIFNSNVLNFTHKVIAKISYALFGLSSHAFIALIMSFLGGFPVGARLVSNLYETELITDKTAVRMLYYTVNPAPAFLIIAVGEVMLNSKAFGTVLYLSNITASLLICFIMSFYEKSEPKILKTVSRKRESACEIFVNSVTEAATSIISVCGFVILFSSLSEVLKTVLTFKFSEYIISLTEISQGAPLVAKNVIFLSFLTGFSGFCVHFQVLSVAKKIKINYLKFCTARIINGGLTAVIAFFITNVFKITLPAMVAETLTFKTGAKSLALSAMLIFMSMTLIISVKQKYVDKNKIL